MTALGQAGQGTPARQPQSRLSVLRDIVNEKISVIDSCTKQVDGVSVRVYGMDSAPTESGSDTPTALGEVPLLQAEVALLSHAIEKLVAAIETLNSLSMDD